MNQDTVVNLASQAMSLAFKVAGPLLLAAMAVGLLVSIFQAVTQIQEMTLTFIPKIIAIFVAILVFGKWMILVLLNFTSNLWLNLPNYVK